MNTYRTKQILVALALTLQLASLPESQVRAEDLSGMELLAQGTGWRPFAPISGTFGPNTASWVSGSGVPTGGPYGFRVGAYNAQGSSAWSNTAYVVAY